MRVAERMSMLLVLGKLVPIDKFLSPNGLF